MKSITSESPCSFFSSVEAADEGAASENNLNNGELKGRVTLEHFTRFEKPRTLYIADYLSREEDCHKSAVVLEYLQISYPTMSLHFVSRAFLRQPQVLRYV